MPTANDFEFQVERAMRAGHRAHMRPVVEKELLHYDILFAMEQAGLLDTLTFQGGTALRLCHGSQRFSEDLDFVGGKDFRADRLRAMGDCVTRQVARRYGLEVHVKEPRDLAQEPQNRNTLVHKWQVRVITAPERRDLPRQMIKIEVAAVPAYTREPRPIYHSYDFLPDGYRDLIVLTEGRDEILADKQVSLVACTAFVRHRDLWDIHWLRQQGARFEPQLVTRKIRDYGVADYPRLAEGMLGRVPEIVHGKEFRDQMSRFIALDVQERTLMQDKFLDSVALTVTEALQAANQGVVE